MQPRINAQSFSFHGWNDGDRVYAVRFLPAKADDLPAPIDRVKRLADRLDFNQFWIAFEKSRREIDHQGRPGIELEYARMVEDMAKQPLWIVLRIIYVAENESACLLQVSSRNAARLRPDDPKVRAFLTRSEIVIPKKPDP